ncbi:ABC transporter ATP-binding protein [Lentilactobacillus curieae]|uniref:ABC transporter ATP-binding protein n=1 Tax=Lentilactobacillus curieae TaxID=1138822 RepID=A0A1S6QIQ4_9LACO|nr:ATP-binding cassette domain-containing protein [Lentilactobacillus curieae]AQW21481.1 ABC transporter ATP-binding protein [Lentilactobacillus curieae]
MTDNILQVDGLNKYFGRKHVLKDVSFTVKPGRIVGLVGPNGAGKSTIMKAILGLFNYNSGKISIDGSPVSPTSHKVLKKVGALIEYPGIYPFLTGVQHLRLFSSDEITTKQINELVAKLKMDKYIDRKAKSYSLGMKQKLGIALALVNHPEFVILDEPMNGLDPQANMDLRNIISDLAAQGTTFLISSHILSELEKLVDDLVVIDQGEIVYTESMAALESGGEQIIRISTSDNQKAKQVFGAAGYVLSESPADDQTIGVIETEDASLNNVLKLVIDNELTILDVSREHHDLESSLLNLLKNDKVSKEAAK